jgi:hypothetical protein
MVAISPFLDGKHALLCKSRGCSAHAPLMVLLLRMVQHAAFTMLLIIG